MRTLLVCVSALIFCALLAAAQHMPVPPGMREADKLPNPADVPPMMKPRSGRATDPAQLRHDADELARLARSIPSEIEQVANGRLPKELNEQLKRIEKLSKQLRREISP